MKGEEGGGGGGSGGEGKGRMRWRKGEGGRKVRREEEVGAKEEGEETGSKGRLEASLGSVFSSQK